MKRYKIAAILMIIHGFFMEICGSLSLIPVFILRNDNFDINSYFSFIVPYFRDNMNLMLIVGALYGIIRIIGAVGLWKNKMWGLWLSVINCVITLALMIFMLRPLFSRPWTAERSAYRSDLYIRRDRIAMRKK